MVINNVWQHTNHIGFYINGQKGPKAAAILMGLGIQKCIYYGLHETRIRRASLCLYVCSCEMVGNTLSSNI
jgi:hypothetical protein